MAASDLDREGGGGSVLIWFFVLAVLATATLYGFWRYGGLNLFREHKLPTILGGEESAPLPASVKPSEPEKTPAPVTTPPKVEEEDEVRQKSMAELKADADAEQVRLSAEIAALREVNRGRELASFAGVRFGEPLRGAPLATEQLDGGKGGFAYVLFAPLTRAMPKPFDTLKMARVLVTPKTRRPFRVELVSPIPRARGWRLNPLTTNLVARLSSHHKCRAMALDYAKFPLGDHTFTLPLGETTLTVAECGGERLMLAVEQHAVRAAAKAEAEAVHAERLAREVDSKALVSDRFPNGGLAKGKHKPIKAGTPKAFCGVVFGSLPPYHATIAAPPSSAVDGGFFIDYRKSKCSSFLNFDHGKAEVADENLGVWALTLYSNDPLGGLSDAEFLGCVKDAIEKRFKTTPVKTNEATGSAAYVVGSLKIVVGPDPRGGFRLRAENAAYR